MKNKTDAEAAVIEAYEEAGVQGHAIYHRPIGTYRYTKDASSGGTVQMWVDVFLVQVVRHLEDWPEKGQRDLRWLPSIEAAAAVAEPDLGKIIRKIPALCRRKRFLEAGTDFTE